MKRVIEFQIEGGDSLLVEVEEQEGAAPRPAVAWAMARWSVPQWGSNRP